jgi:hypothetical protein
VKFKLAPYGKAVRDAALDCLDTGHRLMIFAGPDAWDVAKWYVGRGEPPEHRDGYCMVLPPDQTAQAAHMAWPVRGRHVVVVDTGIGYRGLEPLAAALLRDQAASCWIWDLPRGMPGPDLDFTLSCLHWGHPVAPPIYGELREALQQAA